MKVALRRLLEKRNEMISKAYKRPIEDLIRCNGYSFRDPDLPAIIDTSDLNKPDSFGDYSPCTWCGNLSDELTSSTGILEVALIKMGFDVGPDFIRKHLPPEMDIDEYLAVCRDCMLELYRFAQEEGK